MFLRHRMSFRKSQQCKLHVIWSRIVLITCRYNTMLPGCLCGGMLPWYCQTVTLKTWFFYKNLTFMEHFLKIQIKIHVLKVTCQQHESMVSSVTSWCCIDIDMTLPGRHVPAGYYLIFFFLLFYRSLSKHCSPRLDCS